MSILFRLSSIFMLLPSMVMAADYPPLPTNWATENTPSILPVQASLGYDVNVLEGPQTLGRMTQTIVEIRAWMEKSQDVTDELDKSVETLEKDMATVKEAIARLQQQQPGGNPNPAPPANNDARLDALEARIAKLEASRNTVQAPFKVVDAAGKTLMSITNENNLPRLRLGEPGKAMVQLLLDGDAARVMAVSDGNTSYLSADANHSQAILKSNGIRTTLGSAEEGVNGVLISNADSNQPLGEMALRSGKKLALRLYDEAGKVMVSAGMNPATGGSGTVMTANTSGENVAFLGTSADGATGALGVSKAGKNTAALLSEPRMIVLYNDAGEAITSIAKSQEGAGEGGNITIRQPDGEGVFSAGYNAEMGGGDACVYRAKKQNVFCLGLGTPGMGVLGR